MNFLHYVFAGFEPTTIKIFIRFISVSRTEFNDSDC
jgi:hypothetical protein